MRIVRANLQCRHSTKVGTQAWQPQTIYEKVYKGLVDALKPFIPLLPVSLIPSYLPSSLSLRRDVPEGATLLRHHRTPRRNRDAAHSYNWQLDTSRTWFPRDAGGKSIDPVAEHFRRSPIIMFNFSVPWASHWTLPMDIRASPLNIAYVFLFYAGGSAILDVRRAERTWWRLWSGCGPSASRITGKRIVFPIGTPS